MLEAQNSDRINIKDLVLEEPKPPQKPLFDPKLVGSLTELILDMMEGYRVKREWFAFLHNASSLKILFGDECPDFRIGEFAYRQILDKLNADRRANHWLNFTTDAKNLIILFPERRADFMLDEKAYRELQGDIENFPIKASHPTYFDLALESKFLFPDRDFSRTNLYGDPEAELIEILEADREAAAWQDFAEHGMYLRLLYPQRFKEMSPITDEQWQGLLSLPPVDPLDHYKNVKILAAKDARITENGLEIIMEEPLSPVIESVPELPLRRSF